MAAMTHRTDRWGEFSAFCAFENMVLFLLEGLLALFVEKMSTRIFCLFFFPASKEFFNFNQNKSCG